MAALDERIKAQEEKLKQLKALKQKQEAMKRAAETKKSRADDTRRKILIGAMLLDQMEKNEAMKKNIMGQLDAFLTRPDDRALFDMGASAPAAPQPHNGTGQ
ncbi:mobilization protein [Janthinobacterium sp. BJB303]|nr:mobilization protein [Janthinobacterium sp. BJB303]